MKTRETLPPRFSICINNSEYPASLELHKIYRIVPDKDAEHDGDLRIIDESGEDYLYPAKYFVSLKLPSTNRTHFNETCAFYFKAPPNQSLKLTEPAVNDLATRKKNFRERGHAYRAYILPSIWLHVAAA